MTSWHRNEYLMKGLFVGLWAFVALQVSVDPGRIDVLWNLGWIGAGLVIGLILGIARLIKIGVRPQQNWGAFPLLVLLESPTFIYGGMLIGLSCGVLSGREFLSQYSAPIANLFGLSFSDIKHIQSANLPDGDPAKGKMPGDWLGFCAVGGVLFGFAMYRLRGIEDARRQFWIGFMAVMVLIYLAPNYVARVPGYKYPDIEDKTRDAILKAGKIPDARKVLVERCDQFTGETFDEKLFSKALTESQKDLQKEPKEALSKATSEIDVEMQKQRASDVPPAVKETLRVYDARVNLGLFLLIGLPFLYLLIFCADAEESVADSMEFSALLGASLFLIDLSGSLVTIGVYLAYLVPLAVFFIYTTRVMPGLRTFKHVIRGFSYLNLGRLREAIYYLRRALATDPQSPLAKQGMQQLHDSLTIPQIERDPDLAQVLDFNLCLDRAEKLLMGRPSNNERAEADRFLDLVEQKGRGFQARVDYLSAVSRTHAKDYEGAAELLKRLLDPETPYSGNVRKRILYHAWNLSLVPSKEIEKRVGWAELNKPGRRIEAIGAVERFLAENPQDADALGMKRTLYGQLSESDFIAASATGLPTDFNYDYVEQLGMAFVDDPDPERRDRGMGFLRIAGRGMPDRGPVIFRKLAGVAERAGDIPTVHKYLLQIKACGAAIGPKNFAADQKDVYFWTIKRLSAEAEAKGDALKVESDAARESGDTAVANKKDEEARPHFEAAIDEMRSYLDGGGRNELEAYRKLADLYGKARAVPNAILNAVLMVETGLTYSPTDPDLLKKKDTFYYSVEPALLTEMREKVANFFDVSYCINKAMSVLNVRDGDAALVDWATHLASLARILQPRSNGVKLIEARCMLRQGQRDQGIAIMEDIRTGPKGTGDDQEAWFNATKIMGGLYLEELNRPDLALRAFLDYKEYSKSGADTLWSIARSYEAMGDTGNAIRFYEAVTAYDSHPRFWDAKEAMKRLKGQ